jgi:hypothetical protein
MVFSETNTPQIQIERQTAVINNISPEILSIRTHYENLFLKKEMKINYISFKLDKEKQIEDAR